MTALPMVHLPPPEDGLLPCPLCDGDNPDCALCRGEGLCNPETDCHE